MTTLKEYLDTAASMPPNWGEDRRFIIPKYEYPFKLRFSDGTYKVIESYQEHNYEISKIFPKKSDNEKQN